MCNYGIACSNGVYAMYECIYEWRVLQLRVALGHLTTGGFRNPPGVGFNPLPDFKG